MDMQVWGWPQWTMVALLFLGAFVSIALHGEQRKPHDAPTALLSILIHAILLYAGGFFG